ncbi:hypothetical protein, partial [uncultured Tenacibaculum sp.]
GIRDQGSGIRDQGSGIRDQGSGIRDQGSKLLFSAVLQSFSYLFYQQDYKLHLLKTLFYTHLFIPFSVVIDNSLFETQ